MSNHIRRNAACPFCRFYAATFFAKTEDGQALYRCNNIEMRFVCGALFRAPHPVALTKVQRMKEAA